MNIVRRLQKRITADSRRVILRRRGLGGSLEDFVERFMKLDDRTVEEEWERTLALFSNRHRDFTTRVNDLAGEVIKELSPETEMSGVRRKLFGAYLSMEYSIEAAALFNPSVVQYPPGENGARQGRSFVMSLRAVGEGHISSIEFISGFISHDHEVTLEEDIGWRTPGRVTVKSDSLYTCSFNADIPLTERVLFPQTAEESNGMEDLRLVEFIDVVDREYLGTYTAYDGRRIRSKLLRTADFLNFEVHQLEGTAIRGKGIAIFPRKIDGKYVAIGRQDGATLTLMESDNVLRWDSAMPLLKPTYSYDLTQIGNCGSPIETREGWLLPTHGVGPVRRYALGVALLDLDDPSVVRKYLPFPLLEPDESEREGYVPNVLYTCGWMKYGGKILMPYAMSDTTCGFATIDIDELLIELLRSK